MKKPLPPVEDCVVIEEGVIADIIKKTVVIKTFTNNNSTHQSVCGLGVLAKAIANSKSILKWRKMDNEG